MIDVLRLSPRLQAIDLIKQLQAGSTLPIMRAQMRVRITMPSKDGKRIKTQVLALVDKVEDDEWADEWELVRARALSSGRQTVRKLTRFPVPCAGWPDQPWVVQAD